jgi:hypothetical protein
LHGVVALKVTSRAKAAGAINNSNAGASFARSRLEILKLHARFQLRDDPFGSLTPTRPGFSWFGRVSILEKNLWMRSLLRAEGYVFSGRFTTEQTKTPLKLSFFLSYFSPERLDDLAPKKPKVFDRHVIEA